MKSLRPKVGKLRELPSKARRTNAKKKNRLKQSDSGQDPRSKEPKMHKRTPQESHDEEVEGDGGGNLKQNGSGIVTSWLNRNLA